MDFFNKLLTQIKALWERWSAGQRAGMVIAGLLSLATIAGVGYWASRPDYVALTNHLGPQQAAEIVSVLEAENIQYQLSFAGSAISVPRDDLGRARLALKDVVTPETAATDDIGDGIWSDPTLHQSRMTRQLESRLARSISQISSVRSATVHLTQGEASPFIRNRSPSKASVILELKPNTGFSASDARAIASLISHSVEQLDPENVTVLDTTGRLLSSAAGSDADVNGQLSYRSQIETDLAAKAEAILTQVLGAGHAVVRVTADVDFTERNTKEMSYDPDRKVKKTEKITSESRTGGSKNGGAAGLDAQSSEDKLKFKVGGASGESKTENIETTFENATIESAVREAPGKLNRLTIAAVVQLPESKTADGKAAPASITEEKIEAIIMKAVGFDASRKDQIEVLIAPLVGAADILEVPPGASLWEKFGPLLHNVSLGLAAIVALVLGSLVLRRMKPIVVETESKDSLPAESIMKLAGLSQRTLENPEAAAQVVRSWLNQTAEESAVTRKREAA